MYGVDPLGGSPQEVESSLNEGTIGLHEPTLIIVIIIVGSSVVSDRGNRVSLVGVGKFALSVEKYFESEVWHLIVQDGSVVQWFCGA